MPELRAMAGVGKLLGWWSSDSYHDDSGEELRYSGVKIRRGEEEEAPKNNE